MHIYESGQTIKRSMGLKIGFGGVAYRWIESFSKVFMLLRVEKSTTDTRAVLFLKID